MICILEFLASSMPCPWIEVLEPQVLTSSEPDTFIGRGGPFEEDSDDSDRMAGCSFLPHSLQDSVQATLAQVTMEAHGGLCIDDSGLVTSPCPLRH